MQRIFTRLLLITLSVCMMPAFAATPARVAVAATTACESNWPEWEAFKKNFISPEGRVIDASSAIMHTSSEGQSYALFFALIANDRETFEKLLAWTEENLAQGDLVSHLPAWQWGKKEDGSWGVMDENTAADSDLWIAYAVGEAGRLWANRRYVAIASLMADRILSVETLEVPKLGWVLLPGTVGFTPTTTSVRLNPSYVPLQLMRWFSVRSKDPRWESLLTSSRKLILDSAPYGFSPDWVIYDYNRGFMRDSDEARTKIGSYDAVRVYLWLGMLHQANPDRRLLADKFKPMAQLSKKLGYPPEQVQVLSGASNNSGPPGFSAAFIPFLQASGFGDTASTLQRALEEQPAADDNYYDQVLSLFGLGWQKKLYQFDLDGKVIPRWSSQCQ